jgi:hypothetical protein
VYFDFCFQTKNKWFKLSFNNTNNFHGMLGLGCLFIGIYKTYTWYKYKPYFSLKRTEHIKSFKVHLKNIIIVTPNGNEHDLIESLGDKCYRVKTKTNDSIIIHSKKVSFKYKVT